MDEQPPLNEEFEFVSVWVNSGYGKGSYLLTLGSDCTMKIPDALIQELGYKYGDEFKFELDEEDEILYISIVDRSSNDCDAPDWLKDDMERTW